MNTEPAEMDRIPNVLACDVGNSGVHFARVAGGAASDHRVFPLNGLTGLGEALAELWQRMPQPKKIAASSVNPAGLKELETAVARSIGQPVMVVGRDLPLPLDTDLEDPGSVGADRICAAAAAFDRLGVACVVADFGTAVTIDCVSDNGVFLGGAIMPGLEMAASALATGTAQLPKVTLAEPNWVFGKNTVQAIVGGLICGARGALRELAEAYATQLGHWPVVVVTGGDAKRVCPQADQSQLAQCRVDDLALRGVAIAYYKTLLKQQGTPGR